MRACRTAAAVVTSASAKVAGEDEPHLDQGSLAEATAILEGTEPAKSVIVFIFSKADVGIQALHHQL